MQGNRERRGILQVATEGRARYQDLRGGQGVISAVETLRVDRRELTQERNAQYRLSCFPTK